jgi:hypothetical protein
MSAKPMDQEKETEAEEASREPIAAAAMPGIEDDFGDETLGERQPAACSLEEGCIVCQ